jgi:hypothetical protein
MECRENMVAQLCLESRRRPLVERISVNDPGIGDDGVEPAVLTDREIDCGPATVFGARVSGAGDRTPSGRDDFVGHRHRRRGVEPRSIGVHTVVMHDDCGPAARQLLRIGLSEAPGATGDDGNAVSEGDRLTHRRHHIRPSPSISTMYLSTSARDSGGNSTPTARAASRKPSLGTAGPLVGGAGRR